MKLLFFNNLQKMVNAFMAHVTSGLKEFVNK